jgi:taurine dioxygenase
MYMAYDSLSDELKQRIQHLSCVHDASRNSAGELRLGFTDNTDPTQTVGAVHPMVTTQPQTGKKALMLGRRRNAYIKGLALQESESLLDALWAHATQDRFTWTQVWTVGDVMMWDNTCTLHKRDAFDPHSRRLMYRTQIASR